jgi:hypothetical protein
MYQKDFQMAFPPSIHDQTCISNPMVGVDDRSAWNCNSGHVASDRTPNRHDFIDDAMPDPSPPHCLESGVANKASHSLSPEQEDLGCYGWMVGDPEAIHFARANFRLVRHPGFIPPRVQPTAHSFFLTCADRFDSECTNLPHSLSSCHFGWSYRQAATSGLICAYPHVFVGDQANAVE